MGCGVSNIAGTAEGENLFDFSRRNTIVDKPNVPVQIGEGVRKIDSEHRLVFVFGGPGSAKGCIVNDLRKMFGFGFISAEDLILQHFPKQVEEKGLDAPSNTHELKAVLLENPDFLTLDWVLETIQNEICKIPDKPILVDLIPNLNFMMRINKFIKQCDKEMEQFEKKFPCAFALNLTLSKDDLLKNIMNSHSPACVKPPSSNPKDASSNQGDEMDTSRTKRRFAWYEKSVKDFLNYFGKNDRIVKVNTSSAQVQHIWDVIMNFFAVEMDVSGNRVVNTVVLFVFDKEGYKAIDTDRYPMKEICLDELVDDSQATDIEILSILAKRLDECASQSRSFLVDVMGTPIGKTYLSECEASNQAVYKPQIVFLDINIGQLDFFMHGLKRKTSRKKSIFRKKAQLYKAVCSTENETLLFPADADNEICRRIAICLSELRTS